MLLYGKDVTQDSAINLIEKEGEMLDTYNKKDNKGIYRELELRNRNPVFNRANRPNLFFPIFVDPKTNEASLSKNKKNSVEVLPKDSRGVDGCWTWGKDKVAANVSYLVGRQVSTGAWRIYRKDYLHDESGGVAVTKAKALWTESDINNENGKEVCNEIFGQCPFDFPKSPALIKRCLRLGTTKNDLDLNKEDGGNRKFILVELEDNVADKITAERVRRVIKGVPKARNENLKNGLGGAFSYFELGKPIEMEGILSGKGLPSYTELARYVFYTATGEEFDEKAVDEKRNFIGESKEYEVFLFYKPDLDYLKNTALTLDRAKSLGKINKKKRLVFAPTKYLDQDHLNELRIDFAQLPFEIYKLAS